MTRTETKKENRMLLTMIIAFSFLAGIVLPLAATYFTAAL
jgi:hypothetical protein